MDAAAEIHVGNEQADAGRDARTRLAKPVLRREREQGNINFPVKLTTSRIGNLTRLICNLISSTPTVILVQHKNKIKKCLVY